MWCVVLFFLTIIITIDARYLPENATNNVEEIQHAVCKIDTEEIKASANASITRQLKGVCSTKAMYARFNHLETMLMREVKNIKFMLQSAGYTTPKTLEVSRHDEPEYEDYDLNEVNFTRANFFKSIEVVKHSTTKNETIKNTKRKDNGINDEKKHSKRALREIEILKFNETIQPTESGRAFVYFWKVYDVNDILTQDVYLISSSIDFLRQSFNIKFTPNRSGSKYSKIELVPSRFLFKTYRFVLIHDEVDKDMNSQLLGNYATSFSVSHDRIANFIVDNALLIKLLIYLN